MQPLDFTTLHALCTELRAHWLPSRLEQVYQRDRTTLCLYLRTIEARGWLTVSWHPQAARLCMGDAPPRDSDTFTFSQQLRHQIGNLALVGIEAIAPWERVIDLQFARRPGEAALWHLYVEIMGNYSNVILANQQHQIVTAAHQVSAQQSRVRPIQTGTLYEAPPRLTTTIPSLSEAFDRWQERVALVPGQVQKNLLKTYRGISSALVKSLVERAGLQADRSTESLSDEEWRSLHGVWIEWLQCLEKGTFQAGWTTSGYTVLDWGTVQPEADVQTLVHRYYTEQLARQTFQQLQHQMGQILQNRLKKLREKAQDWHDRLSQSDNAEQHKDQADLLMAYLHDYQPGMSQIQLPDFMTGEPVMIALEPDRNAVQNAQRFYKRHQKLKRTRGAIEPLLQGVESEIQYLEQVEEALSELAVYHTREDLEALQDIRDELVQQGYLEDPDYKSSGDRTPDPTSQPYRYTTPSGLDILVGRNNRQNDQLTFRTAGDYDLWFHAQEISGSHVLLRLKPGMVPDGADLQFAANVAAYHSRGRQSEQVPVIYTKPKFVYKPKGAKPGMTVYKHEKILWGHPQKLHRV